MPKRNLVAEPNQQSIVATCIFNAPPELVFKTMTDPELIPEWWGPRSITTTVDKMEPWSGGSWRFIVRSKSGGEWAFHGVYHSIEAPLRNIFTYEYEGEPGKVTLETNIYEEYEGGTKLTTISAFQSIEDRDNMMAGDMQEGDRESMERLEELLARVGAANLTPVV